MTEIGTKFSDNQICAGARARVLRGSLICVATLLLSEAPPRPETRRQNAILIKEYTF